MTKHRGSTPFPGSPGATARSVRPGAAASPGAAAPRAWIPGAPYGRSPGRAPRSRPRRFRTRPSGQGRGGRGQNPARISRRGGAGHGARRVPPHRPRRPPRAAPAPTARGGEGRRGAGQGGRRSGAIRAGLCGAPRAGVRPASGGSQSGGGCPHVEPRGLKSAAAAAHSPRDGRPGGTGGRPRRRRHERPLPRGELRRAPRLQEQIAYAALLLLQLPACPRGPPAQSPPTAPRKVSPGPSVLTRVGAGGSGAAARRGGARWLSRYRTDPSHPKFPPKKWKNGNFSGGFIKCRGDELRATG